ncbi:E3 ubiquitin-protein ligase UBR4 isoform X5 [Bombus vosnesenskii]|uniref:E3 ubiquitin-protein ligase UBR4 isoform X5 n=1 Tax=Bombus vosnesenskii TaxID=207650 RepID=A0A6J3KP87_9HYME|nr:E3 ubiquitin-protein ligase UBR4 isoform X5 [Bombus vosnesenskii]
MATKIRGSYSWSAVTKPLLAISQGSFDKNDILELAKSIVIREYDFLCKGELYDTFYTSVAILAADYFCSCINTFSKSQISIVCQACRVLLLRLMDKLSHHQVQLGNGTPTVLSTKQLLLPILALCTGQSLLSSTEEAALIAMIKNSDIPHDIKSQLSPEAEKDTSQSSKDSERIQCDLSGSILEQLTMPLQGSTISMPVVVENSNESATKTTNDSVVNDVHSDIKTTFVTSNINILRNMDVGDTLLDMCLNLPHLSCYTRKYQAYLHKKSFTLPVNASDAHAIRHNLHSVSNDINIVHNVISLSFLEPLTPSKLEKLSLLTMSCLYCSIVYATASSIVGITNAVSPKCSTNTSAGTQTASSIKTAEEEYDTLAITVVEKSLEIFGLVSNVIKNSTRAGGHILQNHLLIGVWLLVAGLQAQLTVSGLSATDKGKEEKGKSPSKVRDGTIRVNLMKIQQGFGVLSVALASHALTLMSALLEDVSIEAIADSSTPPEPAPLDILSTATALQRAVTFLQAVPLNHLLFYLATISYRRACTLKRIQKHPFEGDALSQSDSTTYYEDLLSCSDNSTDEEEDSEPILGLWFEETIAPSDGSPANGTKEPNNETNAERTVTTIVPDNREPHGYISLATKIFQFMNQHLIGNRSSYVREYVVNGLVEQQMVILAAIIRDLDHETARTETGTISVFYGATLGAMYSEFSQALSLYTHNLLVQNTLSESLQNTLLQHLGVNPWSGTESTTPCTWPLQVYPRTLSVLAQVLLLKPRAEKEAACISIWHRLITTIVENVCNPPSTFEAENEDLNVEHAQLVLILFHSLNFMQKKSVLLVTGSGAVRCSEAVKTPMKDSQLLHLSRLLLLLEYMMKHLYDAPPALLEQVRWNLFSATSLVCDAKDGNKQTARIFTPWTVIEDNYRKIGNQDEFSMKPRFYNLSTTDFNNQDTPKLDGVACNFILGAPDKMKYPLLVDALIDILNVLNQADMQKRTSSDGKDKSPTFIGLCAIRYCFSICWRLLLMLPPSTLYMDKLALGEEIPAGPMLLYSLIWGPRAACKTFTSWMNDCLIRQGMYAQYARNLLKTVSSTVNSLKYDVTVAKNCITALKPETNYNNKIIPKNALPKLSSLCILAAVIGKLQILFYESLSKSQNETIESSKNTQSSESGTTNANKMMISILPHVLSLTESILYSCRSNILHEMLESFEVDGKYGPRDYSILDDIIAMASANWSTEASLISFLPNSVKSVIDKWKSISVVHIPWNTYTNDVIPAESYILATVCQHISSLSEYPTFSINPSLKKLLRNLVTFIVEYVTPTTAPENTDVHNQALDILIALSMDARTDYLQDMTNKALTKLLGDSDSEARQLREHLFVLHRTYNLIIEYTNDTQDPVNITVNEKIMKRCIKYWEQLLEKPVGCKALDLFFAPNTNRSLVSVLLSITSSQSSQQFATHVLRFFNTLFKTAEKGSDGSLERLCGSVSNLAHVEPEKLQIWLKQIILGATSISPNASLTNVQTPTMVTTNALVAVANTTEDAPKSDEVANVPNNEQDRWLISLSNDSASNNQSTSITDDQQQQQQQLQQQHSMHENSRLLRALTNYIVKEKSSVDEGVPVTILRALIPLAYHILSPTIEGNGFSDLMNVMSTLADAGSEKGHTLLFKAAIEWIELCKEQLMNKDLQSLDKPLPFVEAGCCILNYVADVVSAICPQLMQSQDRATSPPWEGATPVNDVNDSDWIDDIPHEDEDSAADDSDDDSLCNKLCTFTITLKEFMNQHWYHCHTCNMVNGVGVCTVCARVCHRGHDVTYAKYGNFFCDCGAKNDGFCQALTKRSPQSSEHQTNTSAVGSGNIAASTSISTGVASTSYGNTLGTSVENRDLFLTSSLRRRTSSPLYLSDKQERQGRDKQRHAYLAKQLETSKDWIQGCLWKSGLVSSLVDLTRTLLPAVDASCRKNSAIGCHARAQMALKQLHTVDKKFEYTDQLMLPTLGSQEGAFENVRMNYSGEQGQTIRQLLSAHMIRRVAMCCLSSPHGKRQHLAVSHEKGKITVLQLGALLKQPDSSKRKLTLTRLASAPVPFTVLSVTGNQWNEDFLAVCGFKDCHVLTFNTSGTVSDHLVLYPQLETGNFIIKAIWLPGSQTQLALVTVDFVKIYDLGKDALCPQYYFLVPTGKIRDCTFMHAEDGIFYLLIISSAGYIYGQAMDEVSSAKYGPFYVTNTLDVYHPEIRDNGQVGGGGVSIYYSHALQLLFFSYACGKSFIAPLKYMETDVTTVFQINLTGNKSSNGNKSNNNQPQPLCQWSEVPNHPGLICSILETSNNPVILMIKPDTIMIQEIKAIPAKAKIMDMVVIRHPSSNAEHRTTLILLCEDGSLRIYMAGMEQTGYWMSPTVQPVGTMATVKPARKKKTIKTGKPTGSVTFPIDFFEHCQVMNDVEFGGNDLLQIYNVAQIKHRLNTTGMYVVSTKAMGFIVEVTNNDAVLVMTGIRVLLGNQDVQRAPVYIEVFGRSIRTTLSRSRWFDIPLTREESLQADKKLTITFGPSQDPEGVIMVDCIKIYGKTKDAFGWPEEIEDVPTGQSTSAPVTTINSETDSALSAPTSLSSVDSTAKDNSLDIDRMIAGMLEVLELSFNVPSNDENKLPLKATTIEVASQLLILPTPPPVQMHTTALLAALHSSKQAYHLHKDHVLLSHVLESLKSMRELEDTRDIDAENFYRLVLIVRSISISRPQNLAKFTDQYTNKPIDETNVPIFENDRQSISQSRKSADESQQHLVVQLMEMLWSLHMAYPKNMALAPVVVPGLTHAEGTIHAIVEIIHAFTTCDVEKNIPLAAKLYLQLLLSSDTTISFTVKQAIIRVLRPRYKRRRVYIPSPPNCSTPGTAADTEEKPTTSSVPSHRELPTTTPTASTTDRETEQHLDIESIGSSAVDPLAVMLVADNNQDSSTPTTSAVSTTTSRNSAGGTSGAGTSSSSSSGPIARGAVNPLETLLGSGSFPQILDVPPDTDDETMVELAIALSLQDHESGNADLQVLQQGFQQSLSNLQGLENLQNLNGPALESLQVLAAQGLVQVQNTNSGQEGGGHYSDTTASAGGSDDEGSTAATDGSTLRTSPAEQGGSGGSKGSESGGSESGGSAVDSMTGEHNVSGRSSAYGDNGPDSIPPIGGIGVNQAPRSETNSVGVPAAFTVTEQEEGTEQEHATEQENDTSCETTAKLHTIRLLLLDKLMRFVPNLTNVSGVLTVPFMQVLLMLTADLDGQEEKDKTCVERLLRILVTELEMDKPDTNNIWQRTNKREVHLVIMRLLSVLMSRSKHTAKTQAESSNFISQMAASILSKAGVIDYCSTLLKALLEYWKTTSTEENDTILGGQLLKEHLTTSLPDMSPLFLRQHVKGHAGDIFEPYPQLLTEMVLRLPYQVYKYAESNSTQSAFEQPWYFYLCEYMMSYQAPLVRRQVRKLLLFICGNKEKYRQLRDLHALISHIQSVQQCCTAGGFDPLQSRPHSINLPYDSLVDLIEHLKCCVEIATSRTGNWQRFCLKQNTVLSYLLTVSTLLDEGVSPTVLQLLQCAICSSNKSKETKDTKTKEPKSGTAVTSKERREREKSEDSDTEAKFEEAQCLALVEQIQKQVSPNLLTKFIQTFLLETNNTNVRWQAHSLILAIYKNSGPADQEVLLDLLWRLWPLLPAYGRKAAQFVDLLGYFSLKTQHASKKMHTYMEQAVAVLRAQNQLLARHPNANLYANLAQFVELDGYYLESEPCLVCNNPEVSMSTIKLSSIKVDSKFTTTTQIVKLVGSYTISRITLRIGDLKRTKMVRTINIYYNNRSVQAVVELKNKPAMWHKAKKITLAQGQTEIKMEFPLPIVACNLMIEYADFYEDIQASSETLQCPRCSANVPANPGVCGNCGENVFQCHKCRAINYDEKDPFLCHACGFCKYAKFDYTLTGRPCCAVDPIESDDDRKKTVATINTLLEKADRVYKTLISNKPTLEMLLIKISEHRLDRGLVEEGAAAAAAAAAIQVSSGGTQVNRAIQLLAQRYCGECKTSFEELSKIIQRVLACRRELVAYDRQQRDQIIAGCSSSNDTTSTTTSSNAGKEESLATMTTTTATTATTATTMMTVPQSATITASTIPHQQLPAVGCVNPQTVGRCYGCATAATEHCLTLLRALATNQVAKEVLCKQGLIQELVEHNLRKGTVQMQEEVRQLLCLVTRDNAQSTKELCSLLTGRITLTLRGRVITSDLSLAVRHEMALLAALIQKEDTCWEQKLRCVMQLFLMACKESKSPVVMESIILPCLKILQGLVKPEQPVVSKKAKDRGVESLATIQPTEGITIDVNKWLDGDPKHSYSEWIRRMPAARKMEQQSSSKPLKKEEIRALYLMEKYGHRWHNRYLRGAQGIQPLKLADGAWLKEVLFNPSSRLARQVACNMIESLCQGTERKKEVLVLLTCYLEELRTAGESSTEFLTLYQSLIRQPPWKQFLAVRGVMTLLADLLTREIEELHRLEETTLTSDLAQGYSLKMLTELMATFLEQENIKQQYKSRLVGAVLNGYLSLRRLVVQRTRLIDDTQKKLLELLEEMTTGTEEETKAFMAICVETVQKYSVEDVRTPVFIFERLCSIIYPEENDVGEFYLTLEKDSQQEDFLQGRMLGNPYSSLEPGLGPLMRDVKNKICLDCELIALLEDDNGMELLVNNKIISLDLPVKEVYKKIWVPEGGECDAMRVVYRMRGLLGDATEEFVESLNANSEQEVNNEEVYKMANVLADCGGLQVMVNRLAAIQNVNRARPLLQVLLKLFRLSVKVKKNQEVLSKLGAVMVFLDVLQRCLATESENWQAKITEQLLEIIETILTHASLSTLEAFSRTSSGPEHIKALLSCAQSTAVRQSNVLPQLARVLAALTYGNREKMALLCDYFKPVLDFYEFDHEHTPEDEQKLELFCILTQAIERNAIGNTLKDYIISMGIVKDAFEYITVRAPCLKPTLLRTDSDELKDYISKPALKYILRFLTGLATDHEPTQLAVSQFTISIIHRLEQVSSDEHVGSLAENLLEALCTNKRVAELIEKARQHTRSEKKRLAMAMRERQLGALGMQTNDKGQVVASGAILQQMEDLGDETGLVCVICREGYKFKPNMVLAIYTFSKRCNVEEFETKQRKTVGYTTVTHFNVVHVDCHMSAVRLARGRDEWESAALQNANTKCNGLLPLWGPQVLESAFASCLARHNTYLQECTSHRDISYPSTVHDLKLLLLRFAQEKSFHEDSGGGGPQSNMHLIPYLIHTALYVINTTLADTRADKTLVGYLETLPGSSWLENCYEAEGPFYQCTMSLLLHTPARWKTYRIAHLNRLIVLAHQRYVSPSSPTKTIVDITVKHYAVYKSALIFFGLVDCIYANFFKKVNVLSDNQWPSVLAEYIRHNDEAMLKASERVLATYRDELLPCTSFEEFCDVVGLLDEITDPTYISDILKKLG